MLNFNYQSQLEKYKLGIASVFNNTILPRYASDGTISKYIIVPIVFSQNGKYYDIANNKTIRNPSIQNQVETNFAVPQMTLGFTNLELSEDSKRNHNYTVADDIYAPSMWNLGVELTVYTRRTTDAEMIFEQLLPRFTPKLAVTVNIDSNNNLKHECILVYDGVDLNEPEEWEKEDVGIIESTLSFSTEIAIYKLPVIGFTSEDFEIEFEVVARRDNFMDTLINSTE